MTDIPQKKSHVHIVQSVAMDQLLKNPDMVMQLMSFKIMERRAKVMRSLKDQLISYTHGNTTRVGILVRFENEHVILKSPESGRNLRIKTANLIL